MLTDPAGKATPIIALAMYWGDVFGWLYKDEVIAPGLDTCLQLKLPNQGLQLLTNLFHLAP